MFNSNDVDFITSQAHRLVYGDKRDVSRAHRRFLSNFISESKHGEAYIFQQFCEGPGYSKDELQAILAYAQDLCKEVREYIPEDIISFMTVEHEPLMDQVVATYKVKKLVSEMSLKELKAVTHFLLVLTYEMYEYSRNPGKVAGFLDYRYRCLPCSITTDENL